MFQLEQWHNQQETPWKRKLHFIPQKYPSLRQVPAYPRFVKERFLRCLDLYMAPRARKNKVGFISISNSHIPYNFEIKKLNAYFI